MATSVSGNRSTSTDYGIGTLAQRLGVRPRSITRWISQDEFPETPYWNGGVDQRGDRRRYSAAMIDEAERIARELGLIGRGRWDLAESDFGRRVADAWARSEAGKVDPTFEWRGALGWPDARPSTVVDLSTPEALHAARIAKLASPEVDDEIIDLSTPQLAQAHRKKGLERPGAPLSPQLLPSQNRCHPAGTASGPVKRMTV